MKRLKRPYITAVITTLAIAAALVAVLRPGSGKDEVRFGDTRQAQSTQQAKANPASDVQLPTNPRDWETQRTLADGTTIGVTTLHGAKSGFDGKVWVWAPKEYKDPKYANSAFPVLIALPGAYGFPNNYWWGKDFSLQEKVAQAAAQGKSKPYIIVMPVQNPNRDNYYDGADIPGQPKMGTWMSEDVPNLVKENFRTYKSPEGWGFFGSSSGGYIGIKMALQHPDKFSFAIAGGPDTFPDSPLWKGHEKEKQANNPEQLAADLIKKGGPTKVRITMLMGDKEPAKDLERIKGFMAMYNKGPIAIDLHMIPNAGHDGYKYGAALFQGPLDKISRHVPGPVAG
ncbi:esterase family protein [Streptomyces sp. YC504]|uniref:Esterase family protein n=1 Tax=Streptomyces mesophilus TaxID=1775132 RepID=A0A6G4XQF5_9ACTN|nr:alpha/beta hydrolase-fold protein [Streptomyces mesophilus]NGO79443.1 esterase family protein [Streptomyces mesophilus]